MLTLDSAHRSLTGAREHNEDELRIGSRESLHFMVLCDGAGGHARGAEAADIVARMVGFALQSSPALQAEALHETVLDAHGVLLEQQPADDPAGQMHATLVVLWIDARDGLAVWSHVGDSRLYLLRDGRVLHVTRDDSVVQMMVDAGVLDADAARHHPRRSQLVCAMGVPANFVAHTLERPFALLPGDALLLCTDGWWEHFDAADIARHERAAASADAWLATMAEVIRAAARPDQDNHSAIAVRVRAAAG